MGETVEVFIQASVELIAALANGLGLQATQLNGRLKRQTVVAQPKTSKKLSLVASARNVTMAYVAPTAMIVAGLGRTPTKKNGPVRVPTADARNGGVLEM